MKIKLETACKTALEQRAEGYKFFTLDSSHSLMFRLSLYEQESRDEATKVTPQGRN